MYAYKHHIHIHKYTYTITSIHTHEHVQVRTYMHTLKAQGDLVAAHLSNQHGSTFSSSLYRHTLVCQVT
jgi:hypothetical protein